MIVQKLEEERSSGNSMEKIPAALTTSQYAQVPFIPSRLCSAKVLGP
jgi:hypothetical protein